MSLLQLAGSFGTAALLRTYLLEPSAVLGLPRIIIGFAAIKSEIPTYESDVPDVPVEDGPEITDHIQRKNNKLTLPGPISQTPLDLVVAISNLISGGVGAITSAQDRSNLLNAGIQAASGGASAALQGAAAATSAVDGAADALGRSALIGAFERRARFTVVTKRLQYENMGIQKMTCPKDQQSGKQ